MAQMYETRVLLYNKRPKKLQKHLVVFYSNSFKRGGTTYRDYGSEKTQEIENGNTLTQNRISMKVRSRVKIPNNFRAKRAASLGSISIPRTPHPLSPLAPRL